MSYTKLLIILLLMIIAITLFSFTFVNPENEREAEKEFKEFEFNTFTRAVCEDSEDGVKCKDEVFVNCDGNLSKAVDIEECNGIKIDVPKATGFAVFEKGWEDPRN